MRNIDIDFVLNTVFEAGFFVRETFQKYLAETFSLNDNSKLQRTSKVSLSVVPDRETHEQILNVLRARYINDIFISEEFYKEEQQKEFAKPRFDDTYFWILDPIDGSREFAYKNPEFAISLGVFDSHGVAILGIIYNPIKEFFLYMFENKVFSFLKEQFVLVKSNSVLQEKNQDILVSISEYNAGAFDSIGNDKQYLKPVGSIAYKLGLLAAGKCNLVLSKSGKNLWDIAGGVALGIPFFGQELTNSSTGKSFILDPHHLFYEQGLLWGSKASIKNFFKENCNFH